MSRRDVLATIPAGRDHAGLVLHRFLQGMEPADKSRHVQAMSNMPLPTIYPDAFDRWDQAMRALNAARIDCTTDGPLVVGTGNMSPTEVGITLHHTYGVPVVPGEALKGLCRAAAANVLLPNGQRLDDDSVTALFGQWTPLESLREANEPEQGRVHFWEALVCPQQRPFQQDVITTHHPDYYGRKTGTDGEPIWPSPSDDPTPIPFVSIKPGTRFRIALTAPDDPSYLDLVIKVLRYGLSELGIGAKTNVGYGRMSLGERL